MHIIDTGYRLASMGPLA